MIWLETAQSYFNMKDLARAIENLVNNGVKLNHEVNLTFDKKSAFTLAASLAAAAAVHHFIRKI